MADILLPTHLRHARTSFRYVDSTGSSRGIFTGALKTAARGGDRLAATIEFTKHGGRSTDEKSNRAVLRSFIASLRGKQNRAYLFDHSYRRRGSMPTGELLANNTFASGTTGWTPGSKYALTVSDRVGRMTRIDGSSSDSSALLQSVNVTQYLPYVARAMTMQGRGSFTSIGARIAGTTGVISTPGYGAIAYIPVSTGAQQFGVGDFQNSGLIAGDYFLLPWLSVAQCALVDNAPNALLRSDDLTNASWTKTNITVGLNADTDPFGGIDTSRITEDSASSNKFATQSGTFSSGVADYCAAGFFKASTRNFVLLQLVENTGSTVADAWFNLSTGAVGTLGSPGANWANSRRYMVSLGNNWYYCALVSRKTNAATSVGMRVSPTNVDGAQTYTGTGSIAILAYRVGMAQSGVPMRVGSTAASALASGTAQTGSGLYTKGWPVSTNGLLLADDQFEVITSRGSELKILTAPVNSDAAGLAYMQFESPLRGAPADNAPIIVHQPMMRASYSGESPGWDNDPGFWSSASCEFEEACSAP